MASTLIPLSIGLVRLYPPKEARSLENYRAIYLNCLQNWNLENKKSIAKIKELITVVQYVLNDERAALYGK